MEKGLFDSEKLSQLLQFQVERKLVYLSKGFLEELEGFLTDHFITEEDFKVSRKKILDRLGDSKREMTDLFDKFNITLK